MTMTDHPCPLCLRTGEHHPGCPAVTAAVTAPPPPPESWAVVELMGRIRHAGRVTEEERFGAKLGRIDQPLPEGGFATFYFGGNGIFRVTPCSEAVARAEARHATPPPVYTYDPQPRPVTALPPAGWIDPIDPDYNPGTVRRDFPSKPMYHGEPFDDPDRDDDDDSA